MVKTSGTRPPQEINEPARPRGRPHRVHALRGRPPHLQRLGKALPDASVTYRVELTLPNGQVVTASLGLKP